MSENEAVGGFLGSQDRGAPSTVEVEIDGKTVGVVSRYAFVVVDSWCDVCEGHRDRHHILDAGLLEQLAVELARLLAAEKQARQALADAVRELLCWGVELDDERLSYVAVQVDREALKDVRAALGLDDTNPAAAAAGAGEKEG